LIRLTIGASDSNIRESEVERWYTAHQPVLPSSVVEPACLLSAVVR
jgi:hypothetical protein